MNYFHGCDIGLRMMAMASHAVAAVNNVLLQDVYYRAMSNTKGTCHRICFPEALAKHYGHLTQSITRRHAAMVDYTLFAWRVYFTRARYTPLLTLFPP